MATQFTLQRQVKINVAGRPYAGAQAFFYQKGTETLQTVYRDTALTVPHDQPVVADDDGYLPVVWLDDSAGDYRVVILSRTGALLDDDQEVPARLISSAQVIDDVTQGLDSLKRTQAEIDTGIIPVNYAYPPYDLRRYGGIGDNSTDNSTAIANWIAATPRGGKAFIPSDGIYRYSTGFTRTSSISIEGDTTQGSAGSRLKYTGSGVAMTFNGGGSMNGLYLSNFALEGSATAAQGIAIINSYNGIRLHHVTVEAFTNNTGGPPAPGTCLYIEDSFDISMSGCQLRQSRNGIIAGIGANYAIVNTVWIRGCEFTGITNVGIQIASGTGWHVVGSDFSGLGANAIGIDIAPSLTAGANRQLWACTIDTCYFEKALTTTGNIGVRVGNNATIGSSLIQHISIRNCYFDLDGDQISVDYCRAVMLWNNHHGALGGGGASFAVRIGSNALDTVLMMIPRTGISDSGSNTMYYTQDLISLVEVKNNYTSPNKSAFLARPSGTISNVVGNASTVYTLICDSEIKDTQSEYSTSTGIFTAQKAGVYAFAAAVTVTSAAGMTSAQLRLVTSNRTYDLCFFGAVATAGGVFTIAGSIPAADMDAGDTASITLEVSGVGANTADITTGTYFSGALTG